MIPLDIYISRDPEIQRNDIMAMYRTLSQSVNGTVKEFMPTITGATIHAGSRATYFRQGLLVDVWLHITFSVGTGNIEINLPHKARRSVGDMLAFPVVIDSLALSAGYTGAFLTIDADTNVAKLYEMGDNVAVQPLAPVTGTIRGHVRYVGQENS